MLILALCICAFFALWAAFNYRAAWHHVKDLPGGKTALAVSAGAHALIGMLLALTYAIWHAAFGPGFVILPAAAFCLGTLAIVKVGQKPLGLFPIPR